MSALVLTLSLLLQLCAGAILYRSEGDLNVGLLVRECETTNGSFERTLVNSAIWTTERLNDITALGGLDLGIVVFSVCELDDYYEAIYGMYHDRDKRYLLGFITDSELPDSARELGELLKVHFKTTTRSVMKLLRATVEVLTALNMVEDVTVVTTNQAALREFYRMTRKEWMCITDFIMFDEELKQKTNTIYTSDNPLVIFADSTDIKTILERTNTTTALLVPFDGSEIADAPYGSYTIQPVYTHPTQPYTTTQKILPTPILFEIANPLISYTHNIANFILTHCNQTDYKLNCVHAKLKPQIDYEMTTNENILKFLKIEPLSNEFVYNIYHNGSKQITYGVIDDNLTVFEEFDRFNQSKVGCSKSFERCILECENFKSMELTKVFGLNFNSGGVVLRPEPWVFAFLSISALGVVFCVCILVFIISRLCRKHVLEGNPILSILLLIGVIVMYVSVVPFAIEGNKEARYSIFVARSLCVTLPYAFCLALLLSRTILLATVSKEVGFMSHVAGSAQGFLGIFIFAVQLALSVQIGSNCEDLFRGSLLVYLLSYNVILLILLIVITPLVVKSQRNYREGKYFTIAVMLLAVTWSCWLPSYAVLDEHWKDPMLCLGLVSTASILLGTVFIPRTYLMTVSAARERFTSALPSLATATSAMDIYRASTQPVYDCVNIAAINNMRADAPRPPPPQRPDFYSSPDIPEDDDDEFDVTHCDTPPPDKVTRF